MDSKKIVYNSEVLLYRTNIDLSKYIKISWIYLLLLSKMSEKKSPKQGKRVENESPKSIHTTLTQSIPAPPHPI